MHEDTAFLGSAWKKVKKGVKAAKKAARRASSSAVAGDLFRATPVGLAVTAGRSLARGDRIDKVLASGMPRSAIGKAAFDAAMRSTPAGAAALGAISAGQALARGESIDRMALAAARGAVPGGALGRAAFDAGVNVARGQRIDRAALAAGTRAAADAARGAVPGAKLPGIIDPLSTYGARRLTELSTVSPAVNMAARALQRAPALTAASAATVAKKLGVSPQVAQDALRLVGARALPWRPVSRRAASFLRRFSHVPERALTLTSDTGALTVGPARIKLQSGDLPYLIAKKYAGDQSKWSQIASVNPGMKVVHNKDKAGKVIWSGLSPWYANLEVNLPPTWPNLPGGAAPAPGVPSVPTSPAASEVTTAAILQAKATLAAWGKTDGASSAGLADYGMKLEDASPAWGPRDRLMLSSFSAWWNKAKTPALSTSGELTAAHSSALRAWTEAKAASPTAPAVPVPASTEPAPQTLPPMVIPGGTAPLPSWPPTQTDPAYPVDPWPTSPGQPQPGGASPFPSLPSVPVLPTPPAMPGTIPASAPAKKDDSGLGVLAALGALVALLT